METIGVLFGLYMSVALLLIVWGFGQILYDNYKKASTKPGIRILLTGIIMFVIGFGACTISLIGI